MDKSHRLAIIAADNARKRATDIIRARVYTFYPDLKEQKNTTIDTQKQAVERIRAHIYASIPELAQQHNRRKET